LGGEPMVATKSPSFEVNDGFVGKLAATGHHQWSLRFGADGDDSLSGVAVDGAGNVLLAGYFEGTAEIGGPALVSEGDEDIVVAKLGGDGSHVWSRRFGGPGHQFAHDLALDPAGNLVVIGHFDGTLTFDGQPLASAGGQDLFVARLDPAGDVLWAKRFGGPNIEIGWRVTVDAAGDILAAGKLDGPTDFGGGPLQTAAGFDVFLLKLAPNGQHLWSAVYGSVSTDDVRDVTTDGAGAIIFTGSTYQSIDFGGGPVCGAGQDDAYLVKLDSAGAHLWSACFGGSSNDQGTGVAIDSGGNIVAAGTCEGTVDFGTKSAMCNPHHAVFVAHLSSTGTTLDVDAYSTFHGQMPTNIALDGWDNRILIGTNMGQVDFGTGVVDTCAYNEPSPMNSYDLFVAKLLP